MAELPVAKRERYLALGLPKADVLILADELATAEFFDAAMAAGAPAKAAANWVMGDIMAACKVRRARRSMTGCKLQETARGNATQQIGSPDAFNPCVCVSMQPYLILAMRVDALCRLQELF